MKKKLNKKTWKLHAKPLGKEFIFANTNGKLLVAQNENLNGEENIEVEWYSYMQCLLKKFWVVA